MGCHVDGKFGSLLPQSNLMGHVILNKKYRILKNMFGYRSEILSIYVYIAVPVINIKNVQGEQTLKITSYNIKGMIDYIITQKFKVELIMCHRSRCV